MVMVATVHFFPLQYRPQRFNNIEVWWLWQTADMWQIILVLINLVLDDVSCVNRGFLISEDTITIREQSLYHGMDLIRQNVHIINGSHVILQSYQGAHRKPQYGCSSHHRTPATFHSWQQAVCVIGLGWCLPDVNWGRSGKQDSSDHITVFHCSTFMI